MSWINTFDAVFFVTIGTLVTGFLGVVIKYCLKSKCEHITFCWGCFEINRRVDLEVQEEIREMEITKSMKDPKIENDTVDV